MTEARAAASGADAYFAAVAGRYPLAGPLRIAKEESGMNNTTRMVYAANDRYVLRVYDNHRDRAIVRIEHGLLAALQHAGLSFRVPSPVAGRDGSTIAEAPDGKLAALFGYIAGSRPTPDNPAHAAGLGRAAGELTRAFAACGPQAGLEPAYKPYYDFEATHAAADEATLTALCRRSPALAERAEAVASLHALRTRLTALIDRVKRLPHQWIHGDIVFSNALAEGDAIVGLLDFEFCAVDVRAMELAVVLAEFPCGDEERAVRRMELFCAGYGEKLPLEPEEIALLPDLMQLRLIDVWLHFAVRLAEGLDPEQVWLREIERVSFACGWIERRRERLLALFRNALARKASV
ncbi:phosphotransferase [Paenibacillus sp. MWE-103]|uniref:Phosphotransferase n=1 Tax=Paenibacillus artemisiicola TaxID=1172618 RepID=A0ABS3WCH3_9BACL|nr:phosphotransferase [Paenibacillus artemisiicola]MBO7746003.1 phosphotransferase [Paenibacillus artemisiicola]